MAEVFDPAAGAAAARPSRRESLRRWGGHGLGAVGFFCAAAAILLALLGPFLAPASATEFVGIPFQAPSAAAWLGTDMLGRDVLSRVLPPATSRERPMRSSCGCSMWRWPWG
jgi:peptide/nickel transport system permease protein